MKSILLRLFIFINFTFNGYANDFAEKPFTFQYSQLSDHFHAMDQVTESLPEFFLIPEYKNAWVKQFGKLSESDLAIFKEYKAVRKKYQNMTFFDATIPESKLELFAPNPSDVLDIIADAFYISQNIEEALGQLERQLEIQELSLIREFFDFYKEKISSFVKFKHDGLKLALDYLNHELSNPLIVNAFSETLNFYQAARQNFKSILILSSPPKSYRGACYGDHLQLKMPVDDLPIDHKNIMQFLTSVIVHEAIHHISGSMCSRKKQELSLAFLSKVKSLDDSHFLNAIEEPLVMAFQMHFVKMIYPTLYIENEDWFNHPLAKEYLTVLEETLASGKFIDVDFILKLAELYMRRT